jgi:ribonuclease P protein component
MLPKINRIKKKKDFEEIFKKGASFKNSLLILKVVKNNFNESRFGFIVSQKVSKKAVVRNKIRRRLSEIIKAEFNNIKSGLDLVFISLNGIEKREFFEIKESVASLLTKAKCLNQ